MLLRCGVAGTRGEGPELRQPRPHDAQVKSADRRPYMAIRRQLHTHVVVVRLGKGDWHDPYGRYLVRRRALESAQAHPTRENIQAVLTIRGCDANSLVILAKLASDLAAVVHAKLPPCSCSVALLPRRAGDDVNASTRLPRRAGHCDDDAIRTQTSQVWPSVVLWGGTSSGQHARTTTRELGGGPVNLAGVRSAQPVPASPRPPRAAHRPAAARAPRTTPGCTCGHGSNWVWVAKGSASGSGCVPRD